MSRPNANGQRWFRAYVPHGMAGGATSPLIPLYTSGLGGSVAEVGIIAAAPSLSAVPAFLLWGMLSDRLRRRKAFVLIGFLGLAASLFIMAFVGSISQLYLAGLLMGALGAASAPAGAVLVMESAAKEDWPSRLAAFSRMGGIGWIFGLALGAAWLSGGIPFAGHDGTRSLLALAGALALFSAILAWRWIEEPKERLDRVHLHDIVDVHWRIERLRFLPSRLIHYVDVRHHVFGGHHRVRTYLVASFLLFSGFAAFYGFFPIFLSDVAGLSSAQIFVVYIASHVASATAYARVGRWVHDRGSQRMQSYAAAGRAILFPSMFLAVLLPFGDAGRFAVIVALHALVGLCWAVINVSGALLMSQLSPQATRGLALGEYNAIQGFGAIAGPLIGGFTAYLAGYAAGFVLASGFILAGVATLTFLRADEESAAPAAGALA